MPRSATRFDAQAARFDERVGVGPEAARDVVAALAAIASLSSSDVVLEIGPGTGEIGQYLAARHPYVGLDVSRPMLEVFAARLAGPALLVQADAASGWPVRSGGVHLVFASRAAHLIDADHLVRELERVCRPGAYVLVGRVERQPDGLRNRLRDRRRELLGVGGRGRSRALLEGLVGQGATPVERRPVAHWTVETSAADLIAGWRARGTVGGSSIPADVHAAVLDALASEAGGESEQEIETYTLEGVRLP